ncbi:unnamed protein product [Protopolystoma xenopodis]|uniref:Uncharacterized protein n=1 Tax=Protopolystoma xenopodis TaxID=117903 RepID=A0A448XAH6_9PLAT|nr:unnamed protein product [Protopolystoma xenopodis]
MSVEIGPCWSITAGFEGDSDLEYLSSNVAEALAKMVLNKSSILLIRPTFAETSRLVRGQCDLLLYSAFRLHFETLLELLPDSISSGLSTTSATFDHGNSTSRRYCQH